MIGIGPGADRRMKTATLMRRGEVRIAKALPHWAQAQGTFLDHFGRDAWSVLAAQLGAIVEVTSRIP